MKLKEFLKDTLQVSKGAMKIETKGIIEDYRERYDVLRKDKSKPFRHDVYTMTPGNRIAVHIKVPSETVDKFYYDVLLELSAEKSAVDFGDCDVKVFSNCPSFVYSVAYVFAHWNPDTGKVERGGKGMMIDMLKGKLPRDRMLIPGLENKLGRDPVHDAPVTRNPMGLPMFDKSIYFAVFYLMDDVSFASVMNNHRFRTTRQVFDNVAFFDQLMRERKRLENRQKEAKAKATRSTEKEFRSKERAVDRRNQSGMMKPMRAKTVSAVKSTRSPKTTSAVKTTRRVTESK